VYANYSFSFEGVRKNTPLIQGVRKLFIPFEGVRKNTPLIQGVRICIKIGVLFHIRTIGLIQCFQTFFGAKIGINLPSSFR